MSGVFYKIDIVKNCWGYCDLQCCYSCDYDVIIYKNDVDFYKKECIFDDCKNEDNIISETIDKVKKDLGREPVENDDYKLYFESIDKDNEIVNYYRN